MASNEMPFLDNSLPNVLPDVDDLFGEDDVNLGMSSQPPTKELYQRVDDLRRRGCCQSVAWSKAGTIASITPDGRNIEFRFLRCHPEDGSWHLSDPSKCDLVTGQENAPLVHLAWAATGSPELAVIDSVGRVALLTFSIALNRPFFSKKWDADPIDDLNGIVGCYWLSLMPQGRPYNVLHGPAVKDGKRYKYESSFIHTFGPFHPNPSKSSLLCVTTNGLLRLLWSQNNNRVEETTMELESIGISDDLITHASICADKNVLFLVLATASKLLRVVKLNIQWGLPQSDKQPPGSLPLSPSLNEHHLASTSWYQPSLNDSHLASSMTLLSHLEILPSTLESNGQSWAPPLILAVKSYLPTPDSPYQEVQSVMDRWQVLNDQRQSIHPAFMSLGSQRSGQDPQPATRLQRGDPIVFNKIIVGIETAQFGKLVCIFFADGTVEYRDRITMEETYSEMSLDRVTNLHQVGFSFADPLPCLQATFSPTGCSMVQIGKDGDLRWKGLQHTQGDLGSSNQDPQYAAVVAGLTVAAGAAIFDGTNFDDVLAVARPLTDKKRFTYDFASEVVSMLKIHVDYSEESHHDNLVRNSHLQMCLSIVNHLGFNGQYKPRSFAGKFSMLALNARNIIILVTIASNTPINIREKLSPLDEPGKSPSFSSPSSSPFASSSVGPVSILSSSPEVVDALSGCARWSIDLLAWLADSLFGLLDDPNFATFIKDPNKFPQISGYLQEKNDPALHLLLCSSTRGLIVAICRRLQHLEALSNRAIDFWESKALQAQSDAKAINLSLYKAYMRMQRITSSSIIKVKEFETLLNQLGNDIRAIYSRGLAEMVSKSLGQPPPQPGAAINKQMDAAIKATQSHCELGLLLGTNMHPIFRKVLGQFLTAHISAFKPSVDQAKLFFHDYSLLEVVADSRNSLEAKRAKGLYVDVFRRVQLELQRPSPDAGTKSQTTVWSGQWRRCTRCAAVMEDVFGQRPGFTFVLSQQRKCACGGNWGLLPKGKVVC